MTDGVTENVIGGRKTQGLINLALRAGSAVLGLDGIKRARRKIHAVIIDRTLSRNGAERAARIAAAANAPLLLSDETLEATTGKRNCKALALLDVNVLNGIKGNNERQ